jgi:hypothetical protein
MINTLTNLGHKVNLYTIDKTDWIKLREKHNLTAEPDKEHYLQEKTLTPDDLFSWMFRQSFTDFMNRLEPREKQDHRLYKWYHKIKSIEAGVRERVSIREPL